MQVVLVEMAKKCELICGYFNGIGGGDWFAYCQKWLPTSGSIQKSAAGPFLQISPAVSLFPWYSDKDFLWQEYVKNEKAAHQIAEDLGCSHSTILKYLAHHGIEVRETPLEHYKKGQLAYGKRRTKGREIQNNNELLNIEKMKSLRAQGFSYWKIADVFNSMKIPTKNKGSKWHPTTVMKILKGIGDNDTQSKEASNGTDGG